MTSADYLSRFLNVFWLRPETAMWRTLNCSTIEDIEFRHPIADLSCGHGVFSFIRAGGDFDPSFDVYTGVGNLQDFFEGADIHDTTSDHYRPAVRQAPSYRIDVGTDWKQSLLDKSATLDFYDRLVLHDNNELLPFPDESFATIFSNSVYWISRLEEHLRDIRRVLRPGGRGVLVLKTSAVLDYTLSSFESFLGPEWLAMIDRGRKESYPRLFSADEWAVMLEAAGFQVVSCRPQVSWLHAHIWDIGLRPLSPVLMRMAGSLDEETRLSVKQEWIEVWEKLLSPLCKTDVVPDEGRPHPEVVFEVTRA